MKSLNDPDKIVWTHDHILPNFLKIATDQLMIGKRNWRLKVNEVSFNNYFNSNRNIMIPEIRDQFNKNFSEEKYQAFLKDLNSKHPGAIDFRVAETPIFIPKDFTNKMLRCLRIYC